MKSKDIIGSFLKPFRLHHSDHSREGSKEEEDIQKLAALDQKHFSYDSLARATDKFNPYRKLGEGGFGPVFKGRLKDGKEVAVKMLSRSSRQGKKEFTNEAKLLARVQHRNVVNLLGYCMHGEEKLLVYEYVCNESLDKLLFRKGKKMEALDWRKRFDIISGVAKGLQYLHEDAHNSIIHRDIKASNFLLDEKWVPKIADFGMARLFPEDHTHVNTHAAGTNGYVAPEYVMHGHLSVKADVYSFGVLMIELVTGERNSLFCPIGDADNLLDWAYKSYKKGKSLDIMDPVLADTAVAEQVSLCIHIGLLCTQSDPCLRPNMRRVVVLLSKGSSSLEEPSWPGFPGKRYRRSLKAKVSSSSAGTSGAASSSSTFETRSTPNPTGITSAPRSSRSDPDGSGEGESNSGACSSSTFETSDLNPPPPPNNHICTRSSWEAANRTQPDELMYSDIIQG